MPYRSVVICKDYYTQRLYRNLYLTIRDNWNNNNNKLELGPTALDPLLVCPFALGRPVAVGGKCRPVRLLSGAVPLYAPTVKLPRRTVYMYLISAHTYAETPPVTLTFVPPRHLPLSRKQLSRTLLPGLC